MSSITKVFVVITEFLLLSNLALSLQKLLIKRSVFISQNIYKLLQMMCQFFLTLTLSFFLFYSTYKGDLTNREVRIAMFCSILLCITTRSIFIYIDNAEENAMQLLYAVVGVTEADNENLNGHSLNVQSLTMLLYRALPWNKTIGINSSYLNCAALLVDLGKLGISKDIINKSGKLAPDEWQKMKRHPEITIKVLSSTNFLKKISSWIKFHHERVDGKGYYHLKGEEIPLASRIIAVADAYSAITMERSYKATFCYEDAISELRLASGTQLDSYLVEVFCKIPQYKIIECTEHTKNVMKLYHEEKFR